VQGDAPAVRRLGRPTADWDYRLPTGLPTTDWRLPTARYRL